MWRKGDELFWDFRAAAEDKPAPAVTAAAGLSAQAANASQTLATAARRYTGKRITIEPRQLNTDEVSFIIKHRRSLSLGGGNFSSDDMRHNLNISNGEPDARSYLGVPVASGDTVLGVLAIRDTSNTRAFGINDERLLTTVGSQLCSAMQNALLFERINNFAAELNQRPREILGWQSPLEHLTRLASPSTGP